MVALSDLTFPEEVQLALVAGTGHGYSRVRYGYWQTAAAALLDALAAGALRPEDARANPRLVPVPGASSDAGHALTIALLGKPRLASVALGRLARTVPKATTARLVGLGVVADAGRAARASYRELEVLDQDLEREVIAQINLGTPLGLRIDDIRRFSGSPWWAPGRYEPATRRGDYGPGNDHAADAILTAVYVAQTPQG